MKDLRNFLSSKLGATAVEYGLIVAFVALAIIGGALVFGGSLNALFGQIGNALLAANQ